MTSIGKKPDESAPGSDQNLHVGLALVEAGGRILPCEPTGPNFKAPIGILVPHGYLDATSDIRRCNEFWSAREDALPGLVPGSLNVVVIDLDVDKETGERLGEKHWEELKTEFQIDDSAAFKVSTPSGGRHIYMKRPFDFNDIATSKPASKIDLICDAGYVIAPGTILPDGRSYGSPDDARRLLEAVRGGTLPDVPGALLKHRRDRTDDTAKPVVPLDQPAAIDRAKAYLLSEAPLAIEGHGGDSTTYEVALHLRDFGISEELALELMAQQWNDWCLPRWNVEDLAVKVGNAFKYGRSRPGEKSPQHLFRNVVPLPTLAVHEPALPITQPVARRTGWHGDDWRVGTKWLLPDFLPTAGIAAIVGPSGSGKSFLALLLAKCLATGEAFFGVTPEERGGTIILACEARGTMTRRLAGLTVGNRATGELVGGRLPIAWIEAGDLRVPGELDALAVDVNALAEQMLARYQVPVRLIVLDTLRASDLVADENSNSDMARAMTIFASFVARCNALGVIIHHPRKNDPVEAGGGAFRNALEALVMIDRRGKEPRRQVRLDKSRDADERELGSFTLRIVTLGNNETGKPITTCQVETSVEFRARPRRQPRDFDVFMSCLDEALNGAEKVERLAVRARFKERQPSGTNSGTVTNAFKSCVEYAVEQRLIFATEEKGRFYFSRRKALRAPPPLPSFNLPRSP